MESLQAVALVRRFGERTAVADLSFRLSRGEILGFLGPNGAGKTTTFNLLSGLLAPHSGKFLLDGVELDPKGPNLRARMGVVFQHPSLDPKLTGRENLAMGAALYALSGARAKERVGWGLEIAELAERADDAVETYSGGMRRRLELARVLLHEPEVLLMDEPTQGLDVGAARRIWKLLLDLRTKTGLSVLLTTHSPEEAENCDRILVLDKGTCIAEGSPTELRARVGGDVVTIGCDDAESLASAVKSKFEVNATVVEGNVVFEAVGAHELIPRLIEALPRGRIKSVGMRQASIGDVFLKLTGKTIDGADLEAAAQPSDRRAARGRVEGARSRT